jgi:hypothetical protein
MITMLALVPIGLFVTIALLNVGMFLSTGFSGRYHSMAPLLGGLLGVVGFLLIPRLRPYAWLPLLLDPGTSTFFVALPWMLNDFWQTSRYNLLARYTGSLGVRVVQLCLFRKGVFTLRLSFSRPPDQSGFTELSIIGTWQWEEDRLVLRFGEQTAVFEGVPSGGGPTIRQCQGFPSFEGDPEQSLAAIDLSRDFAR